MKTMIEKTLNTQAVRREATRLRIGERELVNLYYESGMIYLERLQMKAQRKWCFDRMFALMLQDKQFGGMKYTEVFQRISTSFEFWLWWSTQLWDACYLCDKCMATKADLIGALEGCEAIIPTNVIMKIFRNEQNTNIETKNDRSKFRIGKAVATAAQ